ncbi:MAG: sulfatase-like hydrolase/transferase [Candidatus Brocadiia bacterium]
MRRRSFLKATGLALGAAALRRAGRTSLAAPAEPPRPNVLWISTEDISPDLGCYGDDYAVSPAADKLASQGTRFDACFAHMGVCAPARSGIITGTYPTHIGTNHMRCRGVPPPRVKCFPELLRQAGYYCTNRSKTDYQFGPPDTAWDICGGCDDWRGRAKGQPFFCVINLGVTHESRARSKPSDRLQHDPDKATPPPYYPDTPIVRRDWAKYYDNITRMDGQVADILQRLEEDGLADDTIVWFWGDHGRGLPRAKRWIYDSGLHVPLIVRVPPKWRRLADPLDPQAVEPGTATDELVAFVDFAPTMLSLCGVPIPDYIQGQAFLGPQKAKPRDYIYGARDRVDEAYDTIRCVRDKRYKYIRNFRPHLPRSLDVAYMNQMPTMKEMRRLAAEGKLQGPERQYFQKPKPIEELYDTQADPHEVHNLADEAEHQEALERLRDELFAWMHRMGDFGMLPEPQFDALKRPGDSYQGASAPGVTPKARRDGSVLVQLTCNTPGASIAYKVTDPSPESDVDGIVLPAAKCQFHGTKPWPRKEATNLAGWRNAKAWVSWTTEIKAAGKLPVHVIWACGGTERSRYTVETAGQSLEGRADRTGGWDRFQAVKLGEVDIPKPGTYTVSVKPVPKPGLFQMDLQAVVLGAEKVQPLTPAPASRWQVYSEPIALVKGQALTAKACRLGFRDSDAVTFRVPGEPIAPEPHEAKPHWRQVVDQSGVVDRVLALKRLDGQGQKALEAYLAALQGESRDPAGPVRYWAALGIHQGHDRAPVEPRSRQEAEPYLPLFRSLLDDEAPVVRVAAAQALCEWDQPQKALPVLVDVLQNHPLSSGRLYAATALNQLGEKARPARQAIEGARKQGGYVRRMCEHVLADLGKG